jgi:hypothetical protein
MRMLNEYTDWWCPEGSGVIVQPSDVSLGVPVGVSSITLVPLREVKYFPLLRFRMVYALLGGWMEGSKGSISQSSINATALLNNVVVLSHGVGFLRSVTKSSRQRWISTIVWIDNAHCWTGLSGSPHPYQYISQVLSKVGCSLSQERTPVESLFAKESVRWYIYEYGIYEGSQRAMGLQTPGTLIDMLWMR